MGLLELPRQIGRFFLRLIALQFLIIYGLGVKLWTYTLRPMLQPLYDVATSTSETELTLQGVMEHVVKLFYMMMMLWWKTVMAVWEVVSRPFQGILQPLRKFIWQVDYEMSVDDKKAESREEWLTEQLKKEKERKEAAAKKREEKGEEEGMEKVRDDGKDGNNF